MSKAKLVRYTVKTPDADKVYADRPVREQKSIKDNRSVKVKTPRSQLEIDQQMLQAPSAHQVDSLDDPRKKLPELGPKPRKQNPAGLHGDVAELVMPMVGSGVQAAIPEVTYVSYEKGKKNG